MRSRFSLGQLLASPTSLWLVVFFLLPLLIMLGVSFLTRGQNPSDYDVPLTLSNYEAVFSQPEFATLERSVSIAFQSTLICFIIGYPLAFFISTRRSRAFRQICLFLVILPFWTNFLVRTYAWQIILGRRGVISENLREAAASYPWVADVLNFLSIELPLDILNTERAVLIGLVYGFLPFMVLPIYAAVERFNFQMVEAAHDLGANDWSAFLRIVFPLTLPGVVAGWILVFIPSIGAFVTPALLGGTQGFMIGNLITRQFRDNGGSWPLGSAASIVIMAIVMIALLIYQRYARDDVGTRGTHPISRRLSAISAWISDTLLENLIRLPSQIFQLSQRWKIRRDMAIRWIGKIGLAFNPIFSYVFLWFPIVILVMYSFNDSRRSGGSWQGFTTRWYENIVEGVRGTGSQFSTEQMLDSVQTSLTVAVIATLLATILGTMVSLALERYRFRGKNPLDALLYLPVVIPDITMGISLLVFFKIAFDAIESLSGDRPFPGTTNVIIAHIAFNISFVAIVVRARLTDMNPRLEEAARDLGANEWRTFWRVTYPLLLPGILAGALLAFTLSLDDFVVTFFVGGGTVTTLTVYVWGLVRRSVPPEINAISTLMILASTLLIVLSLILQGRNAAQGRG